MKINIRNIKIAAELPECPKTLPVYHSKTATLEERKHSIDFLQKSLGLGKLSSVDAQNSIHLISEKGEIQFYQPSGALWCINLSADNKYKDERRPWKVEEVKDNEDPNDTKLILNRDQTGKLYEKTTELFKGAELLSKEAYFSGVDLDQVVQFDKKGKEMKKYPGVANVKFLYKVDKMLVDGPGAKSYAFYNPGDNEPELNGIYHIWRNIQEAKDVETTRMEETLLRSLSNDPEILLYYNKRYLITVKSIQLIYYARPPYKHQQYLFPAIHVLGSAVPRQEKRITEGFEFAKFYNAVPVESYAKANILADYLTTRL